MSQTRFPTSNRAAKVLSATGLGLLAAALAVAPASAALDCDGQAADAADYATELACASEATEGAQVITLTGSFAVPSTADNTYWGSQPLTIEGAHDDVTITGPGQATTGVARGAGTLLTVTAPDQGPTPMAAGNADVTVRNVTVTDFSSAGVIVNATYRALHLSDVAVVDNGAFVAPERPGTAPHYGAAVASMGDVSVTDSYFEGNSGALGAAVSTHGFFFWPAPAGGAAATGEPVVTITGSAFVGNEAVSGAAVFSFGSTVVSDSVFTDNVAETGGAIAAFGATAHISDSLFADNVSTPLTDDDDAYIEGGALAVDGEVTITNSTLTGNSSDGLGGAIAYSEGVDVPRSSLTITDSTLEGNIAGASGGAVWFIGDVAISGSTLADNASVDGAGAVDVSESIEGVEITHSTVVGSLSDADSAAVVIDSAAALDVTHATFASNDSAGLAADLAVVDTGVTTLTASVWSSGGTVPSCEISGELVTAANFDVDGSCTDGWSGAGDIGEGLDPQLGALADNGGPTWTLLPAATSPVVDAVPAGVSDATVDQRGVTRPQGTAHDIGAVEVEPQGSLIEFQIRTDAGIIEGTAGPALAVTDVEWIPTGELETAPPADTMFPYGAARFTVQVPQPGDSVTITLTAPRPFTTLLKSTDGPWSEVDGATFSNNGTTVTYTLTDGGELDEDGEVNGFIVDPVALAVQGTFTG